MKKVLLAIILLTETIIILNAGDLPKFKNNESYTKVRVKMISAGWSPYHSEDADICSQGDSRCENRPEMDACAGTGMANCAFLWVKNGKIITIYTIGENAVYSGIGERIDISTYSNKEYE